ncbi:MAG: hypothetical protein ACRC8S_06770 [Fimbriiglobus sp.]
MHEYLENGCQMVIATHSPILMAYPDAVIYQIGETGIQETAYTETDHYRISRSFLNNPVSTLQVLMGKDSVSE